MWDVLSNFVDGPPFVKFRFYEEVLEVADEFLLNLFPRLYDLPLRFVKTYGFVHLSPLDN